MSPYNESVSVINTPFGNATEDLWDYEEYFPNQQYSVQNRMLFILAVVSMIVIGLSLFVLPRQTGVNTTALNAENQAIQTQSLMVNSNTVEEQKTTEITGLSAVGGISSIFTPEVQYWESKIIEWSEAQNLDPNIVATIMQIESCGNPGAVSIAGAQGLFQVMPFHFSSNENMLDPDTNATRGLNFYNEQLRYTGNDKLLSFAGYNGGFAASGGNYANWPDETKRYYNWAKGIYEDAQSGATSSETLETWLAAGGAAGCQIAATKLNIN
jgi:soluble lytic murein transglycosylase-like protein